MENKKLTKKPLHKLLNKRAFAGIVSLVMVLVTVFYANASGQDFYPRSGDNNLQIVVTGPSGTSTMNIGFKTVGNYKYDSTHNKAWFRKGYTENAIWKSVTGNSNLANVITGDGMFTNDSDLEGSQGTGYNSLHDGLDYAHPDGGVDDPGYYSEK